jgi:hypothetical protein
MHSSLQTEPKQRASFFFNENKTKPEQQPSS